MSEFHPWLPRVRRDDKSVWIGLSGPDPRACDLSLTGSGVSMPIATEPLVLERRGAFFVNHRHGTRYRGGTITVAQMYVEYEIPVLGRPRRPLVLLPGG